MQRVTGTASRRRFEAFAADAADTLFRAGCLMTGDASEAEDLVQETFIRLARRWHRVAAMDHPVAYARRILINLALDGAERRSRQRAELEPPGGQGAFAKTAQSIVVPPQARQRLLQRNYRPRTGNRSLAAGLAAAAVAAGIAVPLAGGGGSQPATAGPVMRLASYTLSLPAGYKLTAATSPPCHAFAVFALPASLVPVHGPVGQNPPYGGQMKAAASTSGGCILAVLAPPYHPTTAIPDPEAPAAARPVQVGRYHGAIIHSRMLVTDLRNPRQAAQHGIKPGWNTFTQLYVRLPDGGGKVRDLVIGAKQLSDAALIKIAANGLST